LCPSIPDAPRTSTLTGRTLAHPRDTRTLPKGSPGAPAPRIVAVRDPSASPGGAVAAARTDRPRSSPLLTVVVPVYNGGDEIVANVEHIRRVVADGLPGEEIELIVVSDGSIDGTAERLLESREDRGIRVIHYDRNLGKGYAVKAGALASHGEWVALVDADLDLDPAAIPHYLEVARSERLDFAIGSKRHPDSFVHYPRSRRIASWLYQQLNRVLFRLDVRDTQVGVKVFSREVVDDVLPLLLVKQFAFDLELLAVATALGHGRIRELPVRLEYRFAGSALRSSTVLRALWDTAAVFYRLRILRTYQRKRKFFGGIGTPSELPLVSLIGNHAAAGQLDYPRLERAANSDTAGGELLAMLSAGARPAGNWIAAAVPFFLDPAVAAVVAPTVAPLRATARECAAAAVLESRLGGGSRRSRHFPGNVRGVSDFPADNVIVRRGDYAAAQAAGVDAERLVAWLAQRSRQSIYTPDTSISVVPAPVFGPHLRSTILHARARGAAARASGGGSLSAATTLSLLPAGCALIGIALAVAARGVVRDIGLGLFVGYLAVIVTSVLLAAVRFRSFGVGGLALPALVATQVAYVAGFVQGLLRRR
jgi:glycosyltransferase involved in cell wall biosynthesis